MLSAVAVIGEDNTGKMLTVYNKGIGGQNSRQGRNRFERNVLNLKPDFVFIYFGLNDTLNEPQFISEKAYVENLEWMVDQARSAGIKPVVSTIHPIGEEALLKRHKKESYGTEGPNGKIDRYNKALRKLIADKQVKVADFQAVVAKKKELVCPDGVHLTSSGYKALAECFYKTVADEIKPDSTIVCLGDSVTWGARVKGSGTTTGETYPSWLNKK